MSNERYNQIIDEAYENYSKEYEKDNSIGLTLLVQRVDGKSVYRKPDKQMFIDLCTYDKTFSEKWGLKIEERELTYPEKYRIWFTSNYETGMEYNEEVVPDFDNEYYKPTPTKLITITYNDIKTEVYES